MPCPFYLVVDSSLIYSLLRRRRRYVRGSLLPDSGLILSILTLEERYTTQRISYTFALTLPSHPLPLLSFPASSLLFFFPLSLPLFLSLLSCHSFTVLILTWFFKKRMRGSNISVSMCGIWGAAGALHIQLSDVIPSWGQSSQTLGLTHLAFGACLLLL